MSEKEGGGGGGLVLVFVAAVFAVGALIPNAGDVVFVQIPSAMRSIGDGGAALGEMLAQEGVSVASITGAQTAPPQEEAAPREAAARVAYVQAPQSPEPEPQPQLPQPPEPALVRAPAHVAAVASAAIERLVSDVSIPRVIGDVAFAQTATSLSRIAQAQTQQALEALDRAERGLPSTADMPAQAAQGGVSLPAGIVRFWQLFVPLSIFVSLLLATGIVYAFIRLRQIRSHERAFLHAAGAVTDEAHHTQAQLRWARILEQVESSNENDWRLAILEADIMLKELLDVGGYQGETMGEQMKQVERADWNTIEEAWEAHKFRNKIAHEGAQHEFTQREAKRIIGLYDKVFREFHFT